MTRSLGFRLHHEAFCWPHPNLHPQEEVAHQWRREHRRGVVPRAALDCLPVALQQQPVCFENRWTATAQRLVAPRLLILYSRRSPCITGGMLLQTTSPIATLFRKYVQGTPNSMITLTSLSGRFQVQICARCLVLAGHMLGNVYNITTLTWGR